MLLHLLIIITPNSPVSHIKRY